MRWIAVTPKSLLTISFLLCNLSGAYACVPTTVPERGTRYLHLDHRGDVLIVTGAGGEVLERRQFDDWGCERQHVGESGVRRGMIGREADAGTGFVNIGVRYYDPHTGRWLSPDPDAQFSSPYLYAFDAPHGYIDPDGADAFPIWGSPEEVVDLTGIQPMLFVSGAANNDLALGLRWSLVTGRPLIHATNASRGMYTVYTPRHAPGTSTARTRSMLELNSSNVGTYFTRTSLDEWVTSDNMVIHLSLLGKANPSNFAEGRAARLRVERLLGERMFTRRLWMVHDLTSGGAFESLEELASSSFNRDPNNRHGFAVIASYRRTHGVDLDDGLQVAGGRAMNLDFERGNWLLGDGMESQLRTTLSQGYIARADHDRWSIEIPRWRYDPRQNGAPNAMRWFDAQIQNRWVMRGGAWRRTPHLSRIRGFRP